MTKTRCNKLWDAGKTGVGALPVGFQAGGEAQRRGPVRCETGLKGHEECWARTAFYTGKVEEVESSWGSHLTEAQSEMMVGELSKVCT